MTLGEMAPLLIVGAVVAVIFRLVHDPKATKRRDSGDGSAGVDGGDWGDGGD